MRDEGSSLWICLVLAGLTVAVYAPVRHFAFLNYDDPAYVTDAPIVQAGLTREGFVWAWTTGQRRHIMSRTPGSSLSTRSKIQSDPPGVRARWNLANTLCQSSSLRR